MGASVHGTHFIVSSHFLLSTAIKKSETLEINALGLVGELQIASKRFRDFDFMLN
jgi:hypothetical protein